MKKLILSLMVFGFSGAAQAGVCSGSLSFYTSKKKLIATYEQSLQVPDLPACSQAAAAIHAYAVLNCPPAAQYVRTIAYYGSDRDQLAFLQTSICAP